MRITFQTPDGPELVQAASLALGLMRATKTSSWGELVTDAARWGDCRVTPAQAQLLDAHQGPLTLLKSGSPALTLAVCPVCNRFTVVAGAAGASCPLTLGCPGKPVRASAATRTKPAAKEVDTAPALDDALFPAPEPADVSVDLHVHVHVD